MSRRTLTLLSAAFAYAAALSCLPFLQPTGLSLAFSHVFQLQSARGALGLFKALLFWAALKLLLCVPLGLLCASAFPDPDQARERARRVVIPGAALSLGLAYVAAAVQTRDLVPSPWAWLLSWAGAGLGAWLALEWRKGPNARRAIPLKLAIGSGILGLSSVLLALLCVQGEPSLPARAVVSADEHRALVGLFRGHDPRKLQPDQESSMTLESRQLDALVAWGASLLKARTRVVLRDGGAVAEASIPIPKTSRWLNVRAASQIHLEHGELWLEAPELEVGHVSLPSFALRLAARGTLAALRADANVSALLGALRELSVRADSATLTYTGFRVKPGLAARLMWGEQMRDQLGSATLTQVTQLVDLLSQAPAGDARFVLALRTAFDMARDQSARDSAILANRSAWVALGIVLGHPKLVRMLGERLPGDLAARIGAVRDATTLRGRNDWVRHFCVSAALTVISAVAPSDAVGMLKEELDSDGGSGFSFADLLADRSGTTLAELSTESEERARALQQRLTGPLTVDELFAPAEGLPEGIPKQAFETEYGGLSGARFKELSAEIERRVASTPLLQR